MKQIITTLLLFLSTLAFSQDIKTSDFIDHIKAYDISDLWTCNKIQIEDDTVFVKRRQPLGFIGDNYQRFYIHFISAIRNHDNPLEYFVYGKTRVKNNICRFQGTITITVSRTFDKGDIPSVEQGFANGDYAFYEDPNQKGSGMLKGKFQTYFYIDEQGKLKYDAIMFGGDGFDNNQFEGTWTSYQTGNAKKCNWGDYRIPDSNELDVGAGEFSIADEYVKNGWENYITSMGYPQDTPEVQGALKKENEKWWINK